METRTTQSGRQKRIGTACNRCRARKIRCSGNHPCGNCTSRSATCVFPDPDRKLVVSERRFRKLLNRVGDQDSGASPASADRHVPGNTEVAPGSSSPNRQSCQPTTPAPGSSRSVFGFASSVTAITPLQGHDIPNAALSNPLAANVSSYVVDSTGKLRYLGTSSTWSFTQRTMNLLKERLPGMESLGIPVNEEGSAYQLKWSRSSLDEAPDVSCLPSREYSLYLINTVKFHLGEKIHLFDERGFMQNLDAFYQNAAQTVHTNRLWYVQLLVILSFGKAFLVRPKSTDHLPPGSDLFIRAMGLLPDTDGLYREPLVSIEVLCLVSLYFLCLDLRNNAYGYIGQALRIALTQGMHREMPSGVFGRQMSERRRNAWWTVYILDKRIGAISGAPNAISDADITTQLLSVHDSSEKAAALTINVKLSKLLAEILGSVYGLDGRLSTEFLKTTQSVLVRMATLAHELENAFDCRFSNSIDAISPIATYLSLLYHHCIVITIRPLLFCLLRDKLDDITIGGCHLDERLSVHVKALLQVCVESACKTLKIVSALDENNLLESFLPFDLESTFSSTFVLSTLSGIIPHMVTDGTFRNVAERILDDMIAKGSRTAMQRKQELEIMDRHLVPCLRGSQDNDIDQNGGQVTQGDQVAAPQPYSVPNVELGPNLDDDWNFDWNVLDQSIIPSASPMLSVAQLLGEGYLTMSEERHPEDGPP